MVLYGFSFSQNRKIDTVAVSLLDRMSAMIGSLHSCSVSLSVNYDINTHELGLIKHSDEQQVFMHGTDKMLVRSEGDKGNRAYLYDGNSFTYYSIDKNQYSQVVAPGAVMTMIDSINKTFGIDFPAADFFYPSFVDDIIGESQNLEYLGITKIGNKECFHIAGITKDKSYQFWISNDAFYLPVKMIMVRIDKPANPQYETILSNWKLNPELPDALFEFHAAPHAKKINMVAHPNK